MGMTHLKVMTHHLPTILTDWVCNSPTFINSYKHGSNAEIWYI